MNAQDKDKQALRLRLPLYNLGCGSGDAITAERILARQPGVIEVYANPATEAAYIVYDPALTTPSHLSQVIQQAGFGPREDLGQS